MLVEKGRSRWKIYCDYCALNDHEFRDLTEEDANASLKKQGWKAYPDNTHRCPECQ